MTHIKNEILPAGAALDEAHVGAIHGAFGSIAAGDVGPRTSWLARFKTLMAIVGPGLIVMVGDNDAGTVIAALVMLSIVLTITSLSSAGES